MSTACWSPALALAQARVAGKEIRVAFELDPALPQAALDPSEIRKVFLNLIVNALEAMEAGERSTLRTRRAGAGLVEAVVEDTGCGMSEEMRARAFDLLLHHQGQRRRPRHCDRAHRRGAARGRMDIRASSGGARRRGCRCRWGTPRKPAVLVVP